MMKCVAWRQRSQGANERLGEVHKEPRPAGNLPKKREFFREGLPSSIPQRLPDGPDGLEEGRMGPAIRAAGAREGDLDLSDDGSRPRAHHQDAVRQPGGFMDVMRNHQHGLALSFPQFHKHLIQSLPGDGI